MNRGFTLLEVLVALVVVVAAGAVVSQGFFAGARASSRAELETTAARLASQKMAELEIGESPLGQSDSGTFDEAAGFRYERTSEKDSIGLYKVAVTVYYADGGGEERSFALHRWMRERPSSP